MLKDLGQAGLWLSGQGLEARDLDEERLEQHLSDLRPQVAAGWPGHAGWFRC